MLETSAEIQSSAEACWILSEGHVGMENQCLGLAEALGLDPQVRRLSPRKPWTLLPPALWWRPLRLSMTGTPLEPPWPRLLVSCGRRSVAAAMAIRRASGGRTTTVHIQDPHVPPSRFDLVVAPRHDGLEGSNVIVTRGALNRVTPDRLRAAGERLADRFAHLPRPLVGVLVGGSNRRETMSPAVMRDFTDKLRRACTEHGAGLVITPSRRTGEENERALRDGLADLPVLVWDGVGENPYFAILALADAIVVTADSVSMVSEACSTGKPVYVYEFARGSERLRSFHEDLRLGGITRPFAGDVEQWSYPRLDETAEAARAVRRMLDTDDAGSAIAPGPGRGDPAPRAALTSGTGE